MYIILKDIDFGDGKRVGTLIETKGGVRSREVNPDAIPLDAKTFSSLKLALETIKHYQNLPGEMYWLCESGSGLPAGVVAEATNWRAVPVDLVMRQEPDHYKWRRPFDWAPKPSGVKQ